METLDVEIAGAGNLNLSGKAETLDIECAGAGTIRAYKLMADTVKLEIAGVCNARVHAIESLSVDMAGVGTVKYMGNPNNISIDKAGLGSVKQIESEKIEEIDEI